MIIWMNDILDEIADERDHDVRIGVDFKRGEFVLSIDTDFDSFETITQFADIARASDQVEFVRGLIDGAIESFEEIQEDD